MFKYQIEQKKNSNTRLKKNCQVQMSNFILRLNIKILQLQNYTKLIYYFFRLLFFGINKVSFILCFIKVNS